MSRYFVIVDTDNLGGDHPDEKFVSNLGSSVRHSREPGEALKMAYDKAEGWAARLNAKHGEGAPRYHKVEGEGYRLKPGFEP